MSFKSLLKLTVATLPIALAACADSASEIRARYGDSTWTAEELTSTPYDRGRLHFTAGRFGLAVQQFELAIGQDPDSVEALNGLAASFDQLQRYELAERYYLRALNLDPENAQTLNNLGFSYLMQRRYDLALAHLQDAYAFDPMNDMVRDNLQQAEAGLELDSQDFLASAVGSAEFGDVAAAPRSLTLRTQEHEGQGDGEDPALVRIEALAARDDIWVERRSAVVQRLVTRPSADLLAAMRDAGLAPRIANFRNQAAVASLQTKPTPWQSTHVIIAEAMVERELSGAIRQDRLADDLSAGPNAAPSDAAGIGDLPQLSATVIGASASPALSDLPQLSAAVIDGVANGDGSADSAAFLLSDATAPGDALGDLTQLSAALIDGDESPVDDEAPTAETENLVMRQEAAVGYEPVVRRSGPSRRDDLPAPAPSSDESPVIEVSNGAGRSQMATRIGIFLESEGLAVERLTNAEHFRHQETVIFYRREWLRQAQELAAHFPVDVSLEVAQDQTSDIKIRLGGDLLKFDQGLFYASRESSAKSTG